MRAQTGLDGRGDGAHPLLLGGTACIHGEADACSLQRSAGRARAKSSVEGGNGEGKGRARSEPSLLPVTLRMRGSVVNDGNFCKENR